jgi:hypothetical protein
MWSQLNSFLSTHLVLSSSFLLLFSVTTYEFVFGVVRENAKFSEGRVWQRIWRYLKYLDVLTMFPRIRRWIKRWSGFTAGVLVGFALSGALASMHVHQTIIHVTGDWAKDKTLRPHTYLIDCQIQQGCVFELCPRSPDPGFDVGDVVKVVYTEEDNGHGGRCNSFEDESRTSWMAMR